MNPKIRIIQGPGPEVLGMLRRKVPADLRTGFDLAVKDAIALVMLPVADLYFFADLASKSSGVMVSEIAGSCPQHITTLALFGDVSAVQSAVGVIAEELGQG